MKPQNYNYLHLCKNVSEKNRSICVNQRSILFSAYFLFVFLFINTGISISQNYNWITPNQTYLKMYVASDGIYRIDKSDFVNAGITVTTIDPRTVKVYYKGNQIPIYFFGEQNGTFDDADYFDFYGMRNYGGLTNAHDINNNVIYTTDEYNSLYSDTSAYFVGWGGAYGLRYTDYNNASSTAYPNDYYYQKLHFEQDLIYTLGQNVSGTDYGNFSNDKYIGEGWYWRLMQNSNFFDQLFNVNSLPSIPQQCRLKIFAYPVNQSTTITNEHRLTLTLNSTIQLDTLFRDNFNRFDTTVYFSSSLLVNGNNTLRFKNSPLASFTASRFNFDMFEVSYPRAFVFDSNAVNFNSDIADSTSKIFKIKGYNSANQLNIYDTKNGTRILNYTFSNDTLIFVGKGNGNYQIINKTISKKPFRAKQKQVPNLVTSSTGTDYLLVYNKLFETPAEQLRQYRNTHDGFRSFKAEIEDIYDVFNYGMEDPVAVRRFSKNVFDTWQTPKVRFICLFGRGSIDPKKNLASSVYYQNFIPVYGNPVTDGYFANINFGAFTYMHQISIGRLPAYTNQEAQDMVNKIIGYENQGLQKWIKQPLFITGGASTSEQLQFSAQSDYFINSYIIPAPTGSIPVKIYMNDTTGLVTYNYSDSIKNSINRGALTANFIAHAGNGYWDYVFEDPIILSNENRLPLIFSMTCFTGKIAEPNLRSYGEKYVTYSNKGAIGFIGTTGWSFSGTGNTYNDYLLNGLNLDTLRRLGEIMTFASQRLSPDSSSFAAKNTNNCYNLIGDPAAKLLLPVHPEFDINFNDYNISNLNPTLKENVNFQIYPKNLGTFADSCKIRFQLLRNNQNYRIKDTIIYNWSFIDSIKYSFSIDSLGIFTLKTILDYDNWYPADDKTNNQLVINLPTKNISYYPLKPVDNQSIRNDSLEFVGINPNYDLSKNSVKIIFQFDTTAFYNSSVKQTYFTSNINGVVTKFKARIPILDSNIVYYWRLNVVLNNDSLGWSSSKRFKVYFSASGNYDSSIALKLRDKNQINDNLIMNLSSDSNLFRMQIFNSQIYARSQLHLAYGPTYITVNMRNYTFDNLTRGLNAAKVSKITGQIFEVRNFRINSTLSTDSLLNFLNSFDSLKYLIFVKNYSSPGGTVLPLNVINKIKEFGSTAVDSVGSFAGYNTWAFIGYLGANASQKREKFTLYPGGGADPSPAFTEMRPVFMYPSGSITQTFGPAQTWQNFNWAQDVYPNSSLYFDVYGIKRNNQDTLLMSNVTTYNNVNLSGINAYQYPYLKLITRLAIDTVSGYQSPVFKGISLNYVGPPEIALDNNSIFKSDSIVSMGDSIGIGGSYYNVGYVPLNGHVRSFYALDAANNKVLLRSDTILSQLKVDSSLFVKATFKVNGLPIHKKYNNQVSIVLEVNALNQNDIYDYNNSVISTFFVKGSITDLNTEVYSDGIKLFGNDYVRSNPDMLIKLSGKSVDELLTSDTSVFRIMLNNQFISLNPGNSKANTKTNLIKETEKGNLILKFTPQLQNGLNDLKLITYKNNAYDTAKFVLNVTNETSLKDVNNYPNPMKTQTTFSFTLTGNQLPTECKIKIYSVAGRVIKEIIVPASIGFNQISWDGRDADGDYIANGVYMYRVVFKGTTDVISDIKKLAVLK
ncbi:MAG: C25 family cysteine peptidase [Ignavibacteria bacterium]